MLDPLGVVVPSGRGLAGREVTLLVLLSLRLGVIAGPDWRIPAGLVGEDWATARDPGSLILESEGH